MFAQRKLAIHSSSVYKRKIRNHVNIEPWTRLTDTALLDTDWDRRVCELLGCAWELWEENPLTSVLGWTGASSIALRSFPQLPALTILCFLLIPVGFLFYCLFFCLECFSSRHPQVFFLFPLCVCTIVLCTGAFPDHICMLGNTVPPCSSPCLGSFCFPSQVTCSPYPCHCLTIICVLAYAVAHLLLLQKF